MPPLGLTQCVAKKPERSTGQAGGIQKYRRLVLLDCSASSLREPKLRNNFVDHFPVNVGEPPVDPVVAVR